MVFQPVGVSILVLVLQDIFIMHVAFIYDPKREISPLRFGSTYSASGAQLTAMERRVLEEGISRTDGTAVAVLAARMLAENQVDVAGVVKSYQDAWSPVEFEVLRRFQKMFITKWDPGEMIVYLTVSKRCPYNPNQKFFFGSFFRDTRISNCLHELQHFFVHKLYEKEFFERGLSVEFHHFKESLTVLLNESFADIIELPDEGYEMHTERRIRILYLWYNGQSIRNISEQWTA